MNTSCFNYRRIQVSGALPQSPSLEKAHASSLRGMGIRKSLYSRDKPDGIRLFLKDFHCFFCDCGEERSKRLTHPRTRRTQDRHGFLQSCEIL
jgi:hypothetical protein